MKLTKKWENNSAPIHFFDSGKGDTPRPYGVDHKTYSDNWDRIFGKKEPKEIDDAKAEDDAFEQIEKQNKLK